MYNNLHKIEKLLFDVCSVGLVLFYSYSAVVQPAATQYHRGIYVILTYGLVFLLYQSKNRWLRVIDYVLIVLSVLSIGYWIVNFEAINYRAGAETELDTAVAVVGVLIGIELARRVVGTVFVILGSVMLLYGVYGDYAPELISHAGDTFPALCTSIFYKSDGVFGIMANVLATYVVLFVVFGAFLERCGAQRFFIDFPLAAVGHKIGGPAKVSVIASGLFGSISGSAIANTVSTGAFTIPMMKKAGFKPHVAGGIEPAASIGGMFMPPIMGAGGFIMAELTGLPYSQIMLVAVFPAPDVLLQRLCHGPLLCQEEQSRRREVRAQRHGDPAHGMVLCTSARRHHRLYALRLLAGILRNPGRGRLYRRELVPAGDPHRSEGLSWKRPAPAPKPA